MMGYSQQKEPYFRGVHWGMSKQEIMDLEKKDDLNVTFETCDSDSNISDVIFQGVIIDLGTENRVNGLKRTYLTYTFVKDSLVKIHFPLDNAFLDTSMGRSYYNELVLCLSEIYKEPKINDIENMHGEWETKETRVTVFVKSDFLHPSERYKFISIRYTQETYNDLRSYRMFLRVTIEKKK